VRLRAPSWDFDRDELRRAFGPRTRAIVINTPNNPTGKVFSREELEFIAALCIEHDAVAVTDEIYEHILYDGAVHVPIASLPGMAERTITINGMSKTYGVTGWRVGWAIAPEALSSAIRKVHDFLTVGAAAPLQEAGAMALTLPDSYYTALAEGYRRRRDRLLPVLEQAGFRVHKPAGAYYTMTEIDAFGFADDVAFARHMVETIGVAVVPGSSFYKDAKDGSRQVRFAFCKKDATLDEAERRLARLSSAAAAR
jgi:aspartate/methionine/tyrosine aminotransferase